MSDPHIFEHMPPPPTLEPPIMEPVEPEQPVTICPSCNRTAKMLCKHIDLDVQPDPESPVVVTCPDCCGYDNHNHDYLGDV